MRIWIRNISDPGSVREKLGYGMNIPGLQHWIRVSLQTTKRIEEGVQGGRLCRRIINQCCRRPIKLSQYFPYMRKCYLSFSQPNEREKLIRSFACFQKIFILWHCPYSMHWLQVWTRGSSPWSSLSRSTPSSRRRCRMQLSHPGTSPSSERLEHSAPPPPPLFLQIDTIFCGSVAGLDTGFGAFLTPGSGMSFFRIPDPKAVFLIAW